MEVELGQRRAGHAAAGAIASRAMPPESLHRPPLRRRAAAGRRRRPAAGPDKLREEFLAACLASRPTEPSSASPARSPSTPTARTSGARTCPRARRTSTDLELFGYVSFIAPRATARPEDFARDRRLHRRDRGTPTRSGRSTSATRSSAAGAASSDNVAAMTLVWGTPMTDGATVATAELGRRRRRPVRTSRPTVSRSSPPTTTAATRSRSPCSTTTARELARESLYEDDGEGDDEDEE